MKTFATIALVSIAASSALAQSPQSTGGPEAAPDGWAYELAEYLMSPYCPGRTISDCPSPQAKSLKMWMIVQEAAGRTRGDVEEELLEKYGEVLRPAPRAEGFGLAAYAFPVVAFLAGGAFIGIYLRRQTRAATPDGAVVRHGPDGPDTVPIEPPAALDPELEKIIDEELNS